jgi:hypothetical protein
MLTPSAKEWTIMAFIAGGESLGAAARDGLLQMKKVGSTKHFDLIAQFDSGIEGPTTRYHLKPMSAPESAQIEQARKLLSDLEEESLAGLAEPFSKLLKGTGDPGQDFEAMKGMKVKFRGHDKLQALEGLFRAFLIGPEEEGCFLDKLRDKEERKKLADPFLLIPALFDSLFVRDRAPGPRSTSTGDPAVLREFLEWGIKSFPSRLKMVVIKGHGDGMSIAWDATPRRNQSDRLRAVELREAFSIPIKDQLGRFQTFDIVGFNSCLMGMIEVYHKLTNLVGLGIASEGPTPVQSWPFARILEELKRQPSMTPRALAQTILDEYISEQEQSGFEKRCRDLVEAGKANEGECSIDLSICDLLGVRDVVTQVGILSKLLRSLLGTRHQDLPGAKGLAEARKASQSYSNGDYVDISDFCKNLQKPVISQDIVEQSERVIESVRSVVLDHRHLEGSPRSHGLSIFFPERIVPSRYLRDLQIREIDWDDFLREYVQFMNEGILRKVGPAEVTVEMAADARSLILTVGEDTKITVGGKPGKSSQLKRNQEVEVEHDGGRAVSIKAE